MNAPLHRPAASGNVSTLTGARPASASAREAQPPRPSAAATASPAGAANEAKKRKVDPISKPPVR